MGHDTADLVIVGAGMVGGWASVFAREAGAERVIVLEQGLTGKGASSRSAGVVRAQGGTPETVALGQWSVDFYNAQQDRYGADSGFRELGYAILSRTQADHRAAVKRVAMQRAAGVPAQVVDATQLCSLNPTLAREGHWGGSYLPSDGSIDPSRNVRAYSLVMQQRGVELRERTAFRGIVRDAAGAVVGVETSAGAIATERVLLTGGPTLRSVGKLVGADIPVGSARHQIAVSEPHPAFSAGRIPMVFDLGAGLYWRLEEGGLLWGMSNPAETPGPAGSIDWVYLKKMQRRLAKIVPITKDLDIRRVWAATIEYSSDHLPIVGPVRVNGADVSGATVACAVGHGMMWGPAVAQIASDLALQGVTDVTDVSHYGMDRFDPDGTSPFSDPIALPFPVAFNESADTWQGDGGPFDV